MKSKVIQGAAAVGLAVILGACSSSGGSPTASTAGGSPTASTAGGSPAAPSANTTPVKIGVEAVFSGSLASVGQSWLNGFSLYMDSVNNQAGGRPLQVVQEDELTTTQGALAKAKKLVEQDKVDILAGITSSADALVVRDYIAAQKSTPLIVGVGSSTALLTGGKASPWVFRDSVCTQSEADPIGAWAYKNVGKTAIIAASDYTQGHEFADVFDHGFTNAGGKVPAEIFSPQGTNDYQPYLTQIAAAKPDFVFTSYNGTDALNFVKQFTQFGLNKTIKLVSVGALVSADILPQEGAAAEGIYTFDMWTAALDNPTNTKFLADYKAKYNAQAAVYAVYGFDAAQMIVNALNSVKGNTTDKQALLTALGSVTFDSPRGTFKLSSNHDPIQSFYAMQVVPDATGQPSLKVIDTIPNVVPPQS